MECSVASKKGVDPRPPTGITGAENEVCVFVDYLAFSLAADDQMAPDLVRLTLSNCLGVDGGGYEHQRYGDADMSNTHPYP